MRSKADVHHILPRFCALIHNLFSVKIKHFRSDNAKELVFADYFSKQGIFHQFSCVEAPQQNSVVERKHHHILNVSRALFFQSQLPIIYWSDCVLS